MKQSDLTEWLFGELQEILVETNNTNVTSVSEAADNVDIADASKDHPYPSLVVQPLSVNPQSAGIGTGRLFVDQQTYDSNDVLQSITYRKESEIRLDLIPITDNDPKLRDDLSDAISDHFSLLIRQDGFPEDVDPILVGESSPQGRPEDFVRTSGVTFVAEYHRFITDNDPDVAEEVDLDVDVSDMDIDDETTDVDAFDEQFS